MVDKNALLGNILDWSPPSPPDLSGNLAITLGPHRVEAGLVVGLVAPPVEADPCLCGAIAVHRQLGQELLRAVVWWERQPSVTLGRSNSRSLVYVYFYLISI